MAPQREWLERDFCRTSALLLTLRLRKSRRLTASSPELHPDRNPGNAEAEERFKGCLKQRAFYRDPREEKSDETCAMFAGGGSAAAATVSRRFPGRRWHHLRLARAPISTSATCSAAAEVVVAANPVVSVTSSKACSTEAAGRSRPRGRDAAKTSKPRRR